MNARFWRGSAPRWVFWLRALVDQLAPDFATPLIREVLALLLCLLAGVLAIYGYLRWLRNEKAMRLKEIYPIPAGC
jgi:putative membrane protein